MKLNRCERPICATIGIRHQNGKNPNDKSHHKISTMKFAIASAFLSILPSLVFAQTCPNGPADIPYGDIKNDLGVTRWGENRMLLERKGTNCPCSYVSYFSDGRSVLWYESKYLTLIPITWSKGRNYVYCERNGLQ